jgi:hypothetical protein
LDERVLIQLPEKGEANQITFAFCAVRLAQEDVPEARVRPWAAGRGDRKSEPVVGLEGAQARVLDLAGHRNEKHSGLEQMQRDRGLREVVTQVPSDEGHQLFECVSARVHRRSAGKDESTLSAHGKAPRAVGFPAHLKLQEVSGYDPVGRWIDRLLHGGRDFRGDDRDRSLGPFL